MLPDPATRPAPAAHPRCAAVPPGTAPRAPHPPSPTRAGNSPQDGKAHDEAPALDLAGASSCAGRSGVGRADLHTVLGSETAQIVELAQLHLDKELVALVAGPGQVGLGRLYALQKSCGESVHAAPPRPGSWVVGTVVCRSEGAITPPVECPALPCRAATVPDTHARSAEADRGVPRGNAVQAERDRGV
ncbi:conserved hypothetical protein [Streptomyces lividans TK24]|nr:conserved hypothetical protein [Streptomyces lividans TK24]